MNYEYPHQPTFSRNEPIGCPEDFVQPMQPDDLIKKIQAAYSNMGAVDRCLGKQNIKLTSIPSLHKNNPNSEQMPRREFMSWCWKNGREIAEMVTELDGDIFDKLWTDITNIFNLTEDGKCAACEKDCDTCIHKDSGPSSPCWLCCDGESFYTRRPN